MTVLWGKICRKVTGECSVVSRRFTNNMERILSPGYKDLIQSVDPSSNIGFKIIYTVCAAFSSKNATMVCFFNQINYRILKLKSERDWKS